MEFFSHIKSWFEQIAKNYSRKNNKLGEDFSLRYSHISYYFLCPFLTLFSLLSSPRALESSHVSYFWESELRFIPVTKTGVSGPLSEVLAL